MDESTYVPEKRKPGRPKGVRNKPALFREDRMTPPGGRPKDDFKHADIATIIARQISMIDWAQQAARAEMMRAYQSKGISIGIADLEKLETLSNAIVRAVDGLKKCTDIAEELAAQMTPEQLLEAALKKVEGQDLPTLRYAIRRLRAYVEKLAPVSVQDRQQMGEYRLTSASDAVSSLKEP